MNTVNLDILLSSHIVFRQLFSMEVGLLGRRFDSQLTPTVEYLHVAKLMTQAQESTHHKYLVKVISWNSIFNQYFSVLKEFCIILIRSFSHHSAFWDCLVHVLSPFTKILSPFTHPKSFQRISKQH